MVDDLVDELASPVARLDKMVEYSCRILARTRPIHAIIRGAADKEAFAADLGRRLLNERLANQTERISRYLAGQLRAGLSFSAAGERYCALDQPGAVPPPHRRARLECRAAPAVGHRAAAAELLQTELLQTESGIEVR